MALPNALTPQQQAALAVQNVQTALTPQQHAALQAQLARNPNLGGGQLNMANLGNQLAAAAAAGIGANNSGAALQPGGASLPPMTAEQAQVLQTRMAMFMYDSTCYWCFSLSDCPAPPPFYLRLLFWQEHAKSTAAAAATTKSHAAATGPTDVHVF